MADKVQILAAVAKGVKEVKSFQCVAAVCMTGTCTVLELAFSQVAMKLALGGAYETHTSITVSGNGSPRRYRCVRDSGSKASSLEIDRTDTGTVYGFQKTSDATVLELLSIPGALAKVGGASFPTFDRTCID